MRLIFEENIERSDFLEIILSPQQVEKLLTDGIVRDYPTGLFGIRNLNVFIRVDKTIGEEDAISERESSQFEERFLGEHTPRNASRKAPKASRRHRLQRSASRKEKTSKKSR